MVVKELQANTHLGLSPVAFIDDDPAKAGTRIHGVPVIGELRELPVILRHRGIEQVIVAMPTAPAQVVRKAVAACRDAGVQSDTVPGLFDLLRWRTHQPPADRRCFFCRRLDYTGSRFLPCCHCHRIDVTGSDSLFANARRSPRKAIPRAQIPFNGP